MQSELKPCPFCGGEAVMQEPHWRDGNLCGGAPFCRVCGIKTPRYWPKRTGTAITAWNTRASDAEITRLTEALRAAEEEKKALREALFNATALIGHSVPMDTTAFVAGEQLTAQGVWLQGRAALAGAKP